jgi:GH15 family glucan-1,4-alpha-glucosidase
MPTLPRPDHIEDYALIGNLHTAALVHRNGAIDWLCLPRFDSPACFARLLGDEQNGMWRLAPVDETATASRAYVEDTLVLTTTFTTGTGVVALIDFMPMAADIGHGQLIRIVQGVSGSVEMAMALFLRFDYGAVIPWVRHQEDGILAVSGPQSVRLRTAVPVQGENMHTAAHFTVTAGERIPFVLSWSPSYLAEQRPLRPERLLRKTSRWWRKWAQGCTICDGALRGPVIRSLITLKALTYEPTGGIVAAPTTSLPEYIGGPRNWDYRYCWVRDAAFTLNAFMRWGHMEEIRTWRAWLQRAVAGKPEDLQIMYSLTGERRLTELELPWLQGFADSQPVRLGNAASEQRQLDVYGELIDALSLGRRLGIQPTEDSWAMGVALLNFLETIWAEPDSGLWEERGEPRHFTYSKVMAWVAFDRAIAAVKDTNLAAPVESWEKTRDAIHADVCAKGFDHQRNSFVQSYGSQALDASCLRIPLVGFLPPDDPRVIGTIEAIQRELVEDGMVLRYRTEGGEDGLPPGEGAFLACTFWLADALIAIGRVDEAREIFTRLLAVANDVGLLAEEYDPVAKRQLGNFPQAFSHVGLLHTARSLIEAGEMGPLRSDYIRLTLI